MIVDDNERPIEQTITEVFEAFFEGISFLDLRGVRANGGEGVCTGDRANESRVLAKKHSFVAAVDNDINRNDGSLERWPKGIGLRRMDFTSQWWSIEAPRRRRIVTV
jgi:hypothetical protein